MYDAPERTGLLDLERGVGGQQLLGELGSCEQALGVLGTAAAFGQVRAIVADDQQPPTGRNGSRRRPVNRVPLVGRQMQVDDGDEVEGGSPR